MRTIRRTSRIRNEKERDETIENDATRVALIQALIPIGLQSVNELQRWTPSFGQLIGELK